MQTNPARSVWLTALILGCVYGVLISIHAWLGLFTNIGLEHWLFLNNVLFISLLIAFACMGLIYSRQGVPFGMLSIAIFFCSILWSVLFLATYIVSTTVFVDRAVQIAFFKQDYIYHGYRSVAEALSTNNNATELIKLQVFSLAVSSILQWGALVVGVLLQKMINIKINGSFKVGSR